jgi:RNA polymerase sigma factor (sigma-70 family)
MQKNLGIKMTNKSKTEITIETQRTFIIRRRPSLTPSFCDACKAITRFASPEDAAPLTGSSAREIYRAVEAGQLHFMETSERRLRVCLNSLLSVATDESVVTPPEWLTPAELQAAPDESILTLPGSEVVSDTTLEIVHPDGSRFRKKMWSLTREAFDLLLAKLDADRDIAARKYETLRAKLVKYFECRSCLVPEELADDTINRVTRRLYEGCEIWATEPASYFYGVARNVLKEYWASPEREFTTLESLSPHGHPYKPSAVEDEQADLEDNLSGLAACLDQLPPESRELILSYYQGDKCERIRHRKQMAEQLGIPPNALRIRVHRIRERLEQSFRSHVGR